MTSMKIEMKRVKMMKVMMNDENNDKQGKIVDDNDEPGGGNCNTSLEHVYLHLHFFGHVRIVIKICNYFYKLKNLVLMQIYHPHSSIL